MSPRIVPAAMVQNWSWPAMVSSMASLATVAASSMCTYGNSVAYVNCATVVGDGLTLAPPSESDRVVPVAIEISEHRRADASGIAGDCDRVCAVEVQHQGG
ncbi:hypothetical protein [Halorhabdus salina]|uniref:hypothetical protein n=1 Tax=Halorhabdus salina TaxID=2750670 RepID=UPI0015EF5C3F|nr:hypothetical protein [Halorhabdus salina]